MGVSWGTPRRYPLHYQIAIRTYGAKLKRKSRLRLTFIKKIQIFKGASTSIRNVQNETLFLPIQEDELHHSQTRGAVDPDQGPSPSLNTELLTAPSELIQGRPAE